MDMHIYRLYMTLPSTKNICTNYISCNVYPTSSIIEIHQIEGYNEIIKEHEKK